MPVMNCLRMMLPSVEFNVSPALTDAKPVIAESGVNVSFESIATLMLPTYMDEITLLTPDAVTVSIFHPERVCPVVYCGPTNSQAEPV